MVKKKPRKNALPKTRNGETMSESAFFGWLRQILRRASINWKPIQQVRKEAQVPYKGVNKRRKFSYICSHCKGEFDAKSCCVHHKIECGSLKSFADLSGFAERLFCEKEHLELICNSCHSKHHEK